MELPTKDGLVGNPLIADGVIYQSGSMARVYANDLRTGKLLWFFDPQINFDDGTFSTFMSARLNRGVAIWKDKVYVATGDCRLVAIDRKTGKKAWDVVSCDKSGEYGQTAAPRVAGDKLLIGNACIDAGTSRGFVSAYSARDGKLLWRFYTVPGDPAKPQESPLYDMAAKTWGTNWYAKSKGCGSVWEPITYDPKLNLVYIGVAPPSPWNPMARAADAGDELFTNSIVALDADTGRYVWHFKMNPNDAYGYEPMGIMVADLPAKSGTRRVVMSAPKNGFFYLLDAKSGQFISAGPFVPQNWAASIDPKSGRPVLNPEARYWEKPDGRVVLVPGAGGAHGFEPMGFNPATGLVYIPAIIAPMLNYFAPDRRIGGVEHDMYYEDEQYHAYGSLVAWDPLTQTERWSVKEPVPINGGVLTTAGNLVFHGTATGTFEAYRADTGEKLWSSPPIDGSIQAGASTVEVDGEQYVVVPSGNAASSAWGTNIPKYASIDETRGPSRLLAFKLGGKAQYPERVPPQPFVQPPRAPYPVELAQEGRLHFNARGCDACHGRDLIGSGGSIPDLRRATAATHDIFSSIVRDGVYRAAGMPRFADVSDKDLRSLQAYLINGAWQAYNEQQARNAKATSP